MRFCKGFTLAEIAVAVVILALLLFGALMPFSAQMEIRNIAETRRSLDSIKDAIVGFALANGRLPCPANSNVVSGSATAGIEQFNGTSCVAASGGAFGVVPWATLGTPEADAWGRRFSYRVSPAFADAVVILPGPTFTANTRASAYAPPVGPPTYLAQVVSVPPSQGNQTPSCDLTSAPTLSSFALCTLGDITVYTRSTANVQAVPMAENVPIVIISHGKNGYGGWRAGAGTQVAFPPGPAGDEVANAAGNTTRNPPLPPGTYLTWAFYSRNPTPFSAACSDPVPPATGAPTDAYCEFDDIVATISASTLIARMVAAGKLP